MSWGDQTKRLIEAVKMFQPTDRLEHVIAIRKLMQCLLRSVNGWTMWMGSPKVMEFSLQELKEFFENLRVFTLRFLEYDLEVTEKHEGLEAVREEVREKDMLGVV